MKIGWPKTTIGEACTITSGGTPSRSNGSHWSGEIPWVSAKDLKTDRISSAALHISKESVEQSATKIAPIGSLLILVRGMGLANGIPIGEVTGPVAFNQDIKAVGPPRDILPRFLLLALRSSLAHLDGSHVLSSAAHGTLKIDTDALRGLTFPVPAIADQLRIVAILDEAFEGIATAQANAEKNLQNARALFDSHLQSVFTQRGPGWSTKSFGEIATFRNGINFTKSSKGEAIRILGVKDFKNSYWAPLDDLESVIPDGALPDTDTLQQHDLVFVRSNGNPELIGRCLLVGEVSERTTHSGFTIRARLHTTDVSATYLCHFLKSNQIRREMIEGGNGANIKSLNQGTLARLVIPFPSAAEQARIVRRLEQIRDETQRLESLYQRKLAALDALKQSLLHQAFSGQL